MNSNDVARLVQQRQNKFIETRTNIESEVNRFLESIGKMDEDVQKRCGYVAGVTAKQLLPELWHEPFNVETYEKQLASVLAYKERVKQICDEINREALACLQSP